MADLTKPQIQHHPFFSSSKDASQKAESSVKLSGYVGPSGRDGIVRLYHSLEDLSHYVEFEESSVLHTQPASENVAPDLGLSVWVKASAPVEWTRRYTNASDFAREIARLVRSRIRLTK